MECTNTLSWLKIKSFHKSDSCFVVHFRSIYRLLLLNNHVKLLYINYWGIHDTLTEATVFPNLRILSPYFSEMHLATVERYTSKEKINIPAGVVHVPFNSATRMPKILGKIYDLIFFTIRLFLLVKRKKIEVIICRGSMAAIFGFFLNRVTNLPFMVESFEPHAEYMADSNTWSKNGIQYKFQKWIEEQSMKHAQYLMPVAYNYGDYLVEKGIPPEKIVVMPCCVDFDKFRFNEDARMMIRNKLGIKDNAVVGIYVGKYLVRLEIFLVKISF
jgi:glycosyltransferase involved in cell wall biosynthesis